MGQVATIGIATASTLFFLWGLLCFFIGKTYMKRREASNASNPTDNTNRGPNAPPSSRARARRGHHHVGRHGEMPSRPDAAAVPTAPRNVIKGKDCDVETENERVREWKGEWEVVDALPCFQAGEQLGDDRCPICLDVVVGALVSVGACMHATHVTCLATWLSKTNDDSCPLCRSKLVP